MAGQKSIYIDDTLDVNQNPSSSAQYQSIPQSQSTTQHLINIMQQHYQSNEKYFVIFLTFLSVLSFYPVIYALIKIHAHKRGMEVMLNIMTVISQLAYKISLVFQLQNLFITEESWHKMLNIVLLLQFCSLMIYLARLPKQYKGYCMGVGVCLILLMQEKDSQSLKYALIPLIFNNLMLICSQCLLSGPVYINSRMVLFGAIWYVISIIAFVGQYHKFLDFFFFFQDLTMFATGLSLFYSWQTYEKHDMTFDNFILQHQNIYRQIIDAQQSYQELSKKELDPQDIDNLKYLEQKSLLKKEIRKQKKKEKFNIHKDEEEDGELLEQDPSPRKYDELSPSKNSVEMRRL